MPGRKDRKVVKNCSLAREATAQLPGSYCSVVRIIVPVERASFRGQLERASYI